MKAIARISCHGLPTFVKARRNRTLLQVLILVLFYHLRISIVIQIIPLLMERIMHIVYIESEAANFISFKKAVIVQLIKRGLLTHNDEETLKKIKRDVKSNMMNKIEIYKLL